jgi:hypothetical protein
MRSLRSGLLAALLLVTAAVASATAAPRPQVFQNGRYVAVGNHGALSFVVGGTQITRLQVRMPVACRNRGTHTSSAPTLSFGAAGGGRSTTYSRIHLPADGATNVSFVADDNARRPEIYLSLQVHGSIGHVSVHARSQAAKESCAGALGFDVRLR